MLVLYSIKIDIYSFLLTLSTGITVDGTGGGGVGARPTGTTVARSLEAAAAAAAAAICCCCCCCCSNSCCCCCWKKSCCCCCRSCCWVATATGGGGGAAGSVGTTWEATVPAAAGAPAAADPAAEPEAEAAPGLWITFTGSITAMKVSPVGQRGLHLEWSRNQ